jgi:hypothetical protein
MAASQVDKAGYKGFGSFHSDNVEELVRQDAAAYRPPPQPFPDPCATPDHQQQLSALEFGSAMRSQFLIDFDRWTFINHGAFGGVLRPVLEASERWRRHAEAQPLCFLDRWGCCWWCSCKGTAADVETHEEACCRCFPSMQAAVQSDSHLVQLCLGQLVTTKQ